MLKKILSVFLTTIFVVGNVVLGSAAETNFWRDRQPQPTSQVAALPLNLSRISALTNDVARIQPTLSQQMKSVPVTDPTLPPPLSTIPAAAVQIREIHTDPRDSQLIVLVQDIHMNTEAQKNMASVIAAMRDRSQTALSKKPLPVAVEGASGAFDFETFEKFPDAKIMRDVADYYLQQNLISAPSYVGITSPANAVRLVGIDDRVYYRENVEAYQQSASHQKTAHARLEKLTRALNEQKQKTLNRALKDFDDHLTALRSGHLPLGAYVQWIWERDQQTGNTEPDLAIEPFLTAYQMERTLDFAQAERERKLAMERLTAKLNRSELDSLLALNLQYKAGALRYANYYRALKNTLDKHTIGSRTYPAFDNYIRYVMLADGIKAEPILGAIQKIETCLLTKLCETDRERDLMNTSQYLYLQSKLINFALTPDEWTDYQARAHTTSADENTPNLSAFERFYELADVRSHTMVKSVTKLTEPTVVMVAGGFHTPQITAQLRALHRSYAVIQPAVTKVDTAAGTAYLSIFTREKSPLDKIFQGRKLFLAPAELLVGQTPDSRTQILMHVDAGTLVLNQNPNALAIQNGNIVSEKQGSAHYVHHTPNGPIATTTRQPERPALEQHNIAGHQVNYVDPPSTGDSYSGLPSAYELKGAHSHPFRKLDSGARSTPISIGPNTHVVITIGKRIFRGNIKTPEGQKVPYDLTLDMTHLRIERSPQNDQLQLSILEMKDSMLVRNVVIPLKTNDVVSVGSGEDNDVQIENSNISVYNTAIEVRMDENDNPAVSVIDLYSTFGTEVAVDNAIDEAPLEITWQDKKASFFPERYRLSSTLTLASKEAASLDAQARNTLDAKTLYRFYLDEIAKLETATWPNNHPDNRRFKAVLLRIKGLNYRAKRSNYFNDAEDRPQVITALEQFRHTCYELLARANASVDREEKRSRTFPFTMSSNVHFLHKRKITDNQFSYVYQLGDSAYALVLSGYIKQGQMIASDIGLERILDDSQFQRVWIPTMPVGYLPMNSSNLTAIEFHDSYLRFIQGTGDNQQVEVVNLDKPLGPARIHRSMQMQLNMGISMNDLRQAWLILRQAWKWLRTQRTSQPPTSAISHAEDETEEAPVLVDTEPISLGKWTEQRNNIHSLRLEESQATPPLTVTKTSKVYVSLGSTATAELQTFFRIVRKTGELYIEFSDPSSAAKLPEDGLLKKNSLVRIGSGSGHNEVVVRGSYVSKYHVQIRVTDEQEIIIEDLGSSAGTTVFIQSSKPVLNLKKSTLDRSKLNGNSLPEQATPAVAAVTQRNTPLRARRANEASAGANKSKDHLREKFFREFEKNWATLVKKFRPRPSHPDYLGYLALSNAMRVFWKKARTQWEDPLERRRLLGIVELINSLILDIWARIQTHPKKLEILRSKFPVPNVLETDASMKLIAIRHLGVRVSYVYELTNQPDIHVVINTIREKPRAQLVSIDLENRWRKNAFQRLHVPPRDANALILQDADRVSIQIDRNNLKIIKQSILGEDKTGIINLQRVRAANPTIKPRAFTLAWGRALGLSDNATSLSPLTLIELPFFWMFVLNVFPWALSKLFPNVQVFRYRFSFSRMHGGDQRDIRNGIIVVNIMSSIAFLTTVAVMLALGRTPSEIVRWSLTMFVAGHSLTHWSLNLDRILTGRSPLTAGAESTESLHTFPSYYSDDLKRYIAAFAYIGTALEQPTPEPDAVIIEKAQAILNGAIPTQQEWIAAMEGFIRWRERGEPAFSTWAERLFPDETNLTSEDKIRERYDSFVSPYDASEMRYLETEYYATRETPTPMPNPLPGATRLDVFSRTQKAPGNIHMNNEDFGFSLHTPDGSIFTITSDGLGGESRGDLASRIMCTAYLEFMSNFWIENHASENFKDPDTLHKAMLAALDHAEQVLLNHPIIKGLPSGAVAVVTATVPLSDDETQDVVLNVGDSRAYLLIPGQPLINLTNDHDVDDIGSLDDLATVHRRIQQAVYFRFIESFPGGDIPNLILWKIWNNNSISHNYMVASKRAMRRQHAVQFKGKRGWAILAHTDGLDSVTKNQIGEELAAATSPDDGLQRLERRAQPQMPDPNNKRPKPDDLYMQLITLGQPEKLEGAAFEQSKHAIAMLSSAAKLLREQKLPEALAALQSLSEHLQADEFNNTLLKKSIEKMVIALTEASKVLDVPAVLYEGSKRLGYLVDEGKLIPGVAIYSEIEDIGSYSFVRISDRNEGLTTARFHFEYELAKPSATPRYPKDARVFQLVYDNLGEKKTFPKAILDALPSLLENYDLNLQPEASAGPLIDQLNTQLRAQIIARLGQPGSRMKMFANHPSDYIVLDNNFTGTIENHLYFALGHGNPFVLQWTPLDFVMQKWSTNLEPTDETAETAAQVHTALQSALNRINQAPLTTEERAQMIFDIGDERSLSDITGVISKLPPLTALFSKQIHRFVFKNVLHLPDAWVEFGVKWVVPLNPFVTVPLEILFFVLSLNEAWRNWFVRAHGFEGEAAALVAAGIKSINISSLIPPVFVFVITLAAGLPFASVALWTFIAYLVGHTYVHIGINLDRLLAELPVMTAGGTDIEPIHVFESHLVGDKSLPRELREKKNNTFEPLTEAETEPYIQDQSTVMHLDSGINVLAVYDGMGGTDEGAAASRIAKRVLEKRARDFRPGMNSTEKQALLQQIFEEIRTALTNELKTHSGTTVSVAVGYPRADGINVDWTIANAGDSRVYAVVDGRLQCLTVDKLNVKANQRKISMDLIDIQYRQAVSHQLEMSKATSKSQLPPALRKEFENRFRVQNALIAHETIPWAPIFSEVVLPRHAQLLLCSDGLHDNLTDTGILDILITAEDPAKELVRAARLHADAHTDDRSKDDDIQVLVASYMKTPKMFSTPHSIEENPVTLKNGAVASRITLTSDTESFVNVTFGGAEDLQHLKISRSDEHSFKIEFQNQILTRTLGTHFFVGRDPSNDLAVDDLTVSSFYFVVSFESNGSIAIRDLISKNGLVINVVNPDDEWLSRTLEQDLQRDIFPRQGTILHSLIQAPVRALLLSDHQHTVADRNNIRAFFHGGLAGDSTLASVKRLHQYGHRLLAGVTDASLAPYVDRILQSLWLEVQYERTRNQPYRSASVTAPTSIVRMYGFDTSVQEQKKPVLDTFRLITKSGIELLIHTTSALTPDKQQLLALQMPTSKNTVPLPGMMDEKTLSLADIRTLTLSYSDKNNILLVLLERPDGSYRAYKWVNERLELFTLDELTRLSVKQLAPNVDMTKSQSTQIAESNVEQLVGPWLRALLAHSPLASKDSGQMVADAIFDELGGLHYLLPTTEATPDLYEKNYHRIRLSFQYNTIGFVSFSLDNNMMPAPLERVLSRTQEFFAEQMTQRQAQYTDAEKNIHKQIEQDWETAGRLRSNIRELLKLNGPNGHNAVGVATVKGQLVELANNDSILEKYIDELSSGKYVRFDLQPAQHNGVPVYRLAIDSSKPQTVRDILVKTVGYFNQLQEARYGGTGSFADLGLETLPQDPTELVAQASKGFGVVIRSQRGDSASHPIPFEFQLGETKFQITRNTNTGDFLLVAPDKPELAIPRDGVLSETPIILSRRTSTATNIDTAYVDDGKMSRRHAQVWLDQAHSHVVIEDLGSTNGIKNSTGVQLRLTTPRTLRDGEAFFRKYGLNDSASDMLISLTYALVAEFRGFFGNTSEFVNDHFKPEPGALENTWLNRILAWMGIYTVRLGSIAGAVFFAWLEFSANHPIRSLTGNTTFAFSIGFIAGYILSRWVVNGIGAIINGYHNRQIAHQKTAAIFADAELRILRRAVRPIYENYAPTKKPVHRAPTELVVKIKKITTHLARQKKVVHELQPYRDDRRISDKTLEQLIQTTSPTINEAGVFTDSLGDGLPKTLKQEFRASSRNRREVAKILPAFWLMEYRHSHGFNLRSFQPFVLEENPQSLTQLEISGAETVREAFDAITNAMNGTDPRIFTVIAVKPDLWNTLTKNGSRTLWQNRVQLIAHSAVPNNIAGLNALTSKQSSRLHVLVSRKLLMSDGLIERVQALEKQPNVQLFYLLDSATRTVLKITARELRRLITFQRALATQA